MSNAIFSVNAVISVTPNPNSVEVKNFSDLIKYFNLNEIHVLEILNKIATSKQNDNINNYQIKVITLPTFIARLLNNLSINITTEEAKKVLTEFEKIFK